MIDNIRKNCLGTVSFSGMFAGQRKAQGFIVYPMKGDTECRIQSDKRAGIVNLETGAVSLSRNQYIFARNNQVGVLSGEELMMLKSAIFASAFGTGTAGVHCDNSGALDVFAA